MRPRSRRKLLKRRHRRVVAALAGAAVMSSALLPGIPLARVQAAADPNVANTPTATTQTVTTPAVTTATNPTTPATATTPAVTTTTNMTTPATAITSDPVQVVTANAARFGFDVNGKYTLLSQNGDRAVVRVRSNGQTFKVDLVQSGGNWVITTIRGIGDMTHPATYTPASFFPVAGTAANVLTGVGTTTVTATLGVSQQILFQTNNYDSWRWYQSTYPQDMAFGVLLRDPRAGGTAGVIPNDALNPINNVDFGRQFVLYAHLGTVGERGYGIGISQVAQSGNDLTVTVRTKSPVANLAITPSKTDDFVTLDRGTLNFAAPIHVTFVDQNGTTLSNYVINPA